MLTLSTLLFLAGCGKSTPTTVIQGETMGTGYSVKLAIHQHEPAAAGLKERIDARLEEINRQMSTYRQDSEISVFNSRARTDPFPVSADFVRVAELSRNVAELSDGAFDPTVAPLVELWGFGPAPSAGLPPARADIEAAVAQVGFRGILIDASVRTIRKARPDLRLDFSAVAKGFAVDAVFEMLAEAGYRDFLVEIGGEVRARGLRPDGNPWRVAVEKPLDGERLVEVVVPLDDRAIATSGDYRNFFEVDGRRYAHILDPRTGWPPENGVASVSVIASDAMTADAMATALMVMGPDQGLRLAAKQDLAVLFILRGHQGLYSRASRSFDDLQSGDFTEPH
ncbi:MAG: FAD:protein FMN transferase [Pseudomonadota bacterium]